MARCRGRFEHISDRRRKYLVSDHHHCSPQHRSHPTISVNSCTTNNPTPVSLKATDPDNDQVKIGVDWDDDGLIDQWVPASGLVSSGSQQSATHTFIVDGSHTIQAKAQDSSGATSPWVSSTFQCSAACSNGLNITQYPSCACPAGQVQSGNTCLTPSCSNGLDITQYPSCQCLSGQQSGNICVSACTNGLDSAQYPSCQCPSGQVQVGSQCLPATCSNGLDSSTYPSCSCPAGYTQSGQICVQNNSTCQNGLNISLYPSCTCPAGSTQQGSQCIPNTCQNGLDPNQYPSCLCPTGYHQSGNQCVPDSCSNGLDIQQFPNCQCPSGTSFNGSTCVSGTITSCTNGLDFTLYPSCTCPAGKVQAGSQCVCQAAYSCQGTNLMYTSASCQTTQSQTCQYGCSNAACNPPPEPTGSISATPLLVQSGHTVSISWSATNVQSGSCTVSGASDSWSGESGSQTSSAITGQVTYTLHCTGLNGGALQKSVTVNVVPVTSEQ